MTLRAGVIGLGMMGRNHVRVLHDLDGVELIGVAEPLGDRHGIAHGAPVVASTDELLDLGIDMCVVAAPTADHEKVGLQLAEAGVHTLIEKPLAEDVASGRRLVNVYQQRGLVGCVGHIERYNPALQALQQRLAAEELGEIFQIATRRQGPFPARVRDVGVVKDLATHDLDLTAWVADSPFSAIAARTSHKTGREHEDLVAATGQLRNGTVTNHVVNWLTPMKERIITVTGDRGTFVADTLTADLSFFANADVPLEWAAISQFRGVSEGDMTRYAIPKPEPLVSELKAFRDAVLHGSNNIVTMHEALAAVAVAESVLRSAREGITVALGQELDP